MFKATGRVIYDPTAKGTRNNPWWIILRIPSDIVTYYRYWLWWRKRIKVTESAWGAHITISRGTMPLYPELWNKHQNRELEFEYEPILKQFGPYWSLDVFFPEAEIIRTELGLWPTPQIPFHITVGREVKYL